MFSFFSKKNKPPKINQPSVGLSDMQGEIRTLKGDYKEFISGGKKTDEKETVLPSPDSFRQSKEGEEPFVRQSMTAAPAFPTTLRKKPQFSQSQSKRQEETDRPAQEKTKSPEPEKTPGKESFSTAATVGSDSYYPNKSPFEKINKISQKQPAVGVPEKSQKKKSKGMALFLVMLFLIVAILGSGLFYYWFFMKQPVETETSADTMPEQAGMNQDQEQEQVEESQSVKALIINPAWQGSELQDAFRLMATNFLAESSEGQIIEVRPVNSEYQQFSVQSFIAMFPITIPETIIEKLVSDEYSLFLKNEHSEIRSGAVFKISETENVTSTLSGEEPRLAAEIEPLYLGAELPPVSISFSSSHYNGADIRYYNFPSPPNTSLDYSLIETPDGGYLIFAVSKYSIRSILDYMSEK